MEGLGVINRQAVENIIKVFLLIFLEIHSVNRKYKNKENKKHLLEFISSVERSEDLVVT